MSPEDIEAAAKELFAALQSCCAVEPLRTRFPGITVDEAYRVSLKFLEARLRRGERVVGNKVGITSKAVQRMLDVHQPDFGYITDAMLVPPGADACIAGRLIQPRAEGEIAFVLKRDLKGPGVTAAHVLAALDFAIPCIEIVDSRIRDWRIGIEDTVADNASCGLVALGTCAIDPRALDLSLVGCVLEKNGEIVSTGAGAACLGSPIHSLVWLANALGHFDVPLLAGQVVLSGALVPLESVKPDDVVRVAIDRIGSLTVRFT